MHVRDGGIHDDVCCGIRYSPASVIRVRGISRHACAAKETIAIRLSAPRDVMTKLRASFSSLSFLPFMLALRSTTATKSTGTLPAVCEAPSAAGSVGVGQVSPSAGLSMEGAGRGEGECGEGVMMSSLEEAVTVMSTPKSPPRPSRTAAFVEASEQRPTRRSCGMIARFCGGGSGSSSTYTAGSRGSTA